jgi:hypothetical protein
LTDVKIKRTTFALRLEWHWSIKLLWATDAYEILLLFVLCSANVRVSGDVLSDKTSRTSNTKEFFQTDGENGGIWTCGPPGHRNARARLCHRFGKLTDLSVMENNRKNSGDGHEETSRARTVVLAILSLKLYWNIKKELSNWNLW